MTGNVASTTLLSLCLLSAAFARKQETGFLDRTISVGGATYLYQVFVPATWDPHQKWPVILFLHGAGERGDDGLIQTDVGLGHAIRQHAADWPFVVVMPQCRKEKIWSDADMEAQVFAALDRSIKEFHGDRDRVYLTGLSMGGFATWDFAAKYPGRFAALVPVCAGIQPLKDWPQLRVSLADDPKVADPYAETARRIGRTPVWIFHGDADPAVPVEESRKMAAALKAANANFIYTEYPGVGHNSWEQAYPEPSLPTWLLGKTLKH